MRISMRSKRESHTEIFYEIYLITQCDFMLSLEILFFKKILIDCSWQVNLELYGYTYYTNELINEIQ